MPEIHLRLDPNTDEIRTVVGYKYNPAVGNRNKLGGMPNWLLSEEWPSCCGSRMTFYAQLDSIGYQFDLADCGMIYVFVCFDCYNATAILQGGWSMKSEEYLSSGAPNRSLQPQAWLS